MAGETITSITDLLGLNSPRGLLNFGNTSNGFCTPPPTSPNYQFNYDEPKHQTSSPLNYAAVASPVKKFQRNMSLGSAGSSPSTPPSNYFPSHSFRGSSVRSNSPETNLSGISSADNLSEILNTLTLNDNLARNILYNNNNDLDITNLQNLQAIQALKYLQQPTGLLSSLLPNAYAHNNVQQILDKWNGNAASLWNFVPENLQLDRAARFHRSAAC
ncbi:unnamed protein product, partial [Callosobruchus maculatus]